MATPLPRSNARPTPRIAVGSVLALALVVLAASHHWSLGAAAACMAYAVFWIEAPLFEDRGSPLRAQNSNHRAGALGSSEARILEELTRSLTAPTLEVSRAARMGFAPLDREERRAASTLERATGALLEFLEDEEALAGGIADRSGVPRRRFALERAVSRGAEEAAAAAARPRAAVRYHVSREVPVDVFGDEKRLTQCVRVMARECLRFVREGSLIVSVTSRGDAFGWTRLRFAFRVQGVIAPEAEFSPRAAEICRRLVESMGGALCLERQHYADAQFELDFPAENGPGPKLLFESLP